MAISVAPSPAGPKNGEPPAYGKLHRIRIGWVARRDASCTHNGLTVHGAQVRERNFAYEISDEISSRGGLSGMVKAKPSKRDVCPF
jgi:hypothetical protein